MQVSGRAERGLCWPGIREPGGDPCAGAGPCAAAAHHCGGRPHPQGQSSLPLPCHRVLLICAMPLLGLLGLVVVVLLLLLLVLCYTDTMFLAMLCSVLLCCLPCSVLCCLIVLLCGVYSSQSHALCCAVQCCMAYTGFLKQPAHHNKDMQ